MPRPIVVFALLGIAAFGPARAETTQCTNITSLPAVITSQGIYCLKHDLSTAITSGSAISINTNNVTLDCNDRKIGGLAGGISTNAIGISASGPLNATIRNCGVRGFSTGIRLYGGAGHLLEDNRVDQSTYEGIELYGDGIIVRRNRIVDTDGRPNSTYSYGMNVVTGSSGVQVTDNFLSNVTVAGNPGFAFGLSFAGVGHEIARNVFSNILPTGSGSAFGTYGATGAIASLRDNTAINAVTTPGTGIDGGTDASQCKGNTVHGFSVGLAFCVNVFGNSSN